MLKFSQVSLRRGSQLLFSDVDLNLFQGDKAGVIGANGSGKSSFFAIVRRELAPDSGEFDCPEAWQIAHVSQEVHALNRTALDFVLDGDTRFRAVATALAVATEQNDGAQLAKQHAAFEAAGGYDAPARAARLLHGLGFDTRDETREVNEFSGGWRMRLNLAQALMCPSDLLLLDEPTNHLDLDAILWLERWLREYRGTLLLITHDQEFLDRVVDRIICIENSMITAYRGNYSQFAEQRAAQLAQQDALYQRQQRQIQHMESFITRFRAKASKAKQAQSRLKALERMTRVAPVHIAASQSLEFSNPIKLPRPLLVLDKQSAGYSEQPLLREICLTLAPESRIALLGRNGAGKSTCMKLLAGQLIAQSGSRVAAKDLQIGYFAQHQLEQLNADLSPLENLRRCANELQKSVTEPQLREYLARFGFQSDRVFEPIAPFSGGEKARLALALVTYHQPNLLLLDEPTNHLDLAMRQALVNALQDYTGAVVLVSHDRHLLRTVADEFYIVHAGAVTPFTGDLEDYAKWLDSTTAPSAATRSTNNKSSQKDMKRAQAEQRNRLSPLRKAVTASEQHWAALLASDAELKTALANPQIYSAEATSKRTMLLAQAAEMNRQLLQAEADWLAASEALEAAQASLQL
jgi:ATP-binding cassette, subfamily F, member 3